MFIRWFAVFVVLIQAQFAMAQKAAEGKPDIVLIYADDLGYGDLGCYGATDAVTPNIDRLAAGGVRFTQGYASAPLCAPSRAGLMTGRYQQRFGYYTNVESTEAGLPHTEFNLAQLLRREGYVTGLVGKWHLGQFPSFHPNERGFDEFYGFLRAAHDYYDLRIPPLDPDKSYFQQRLHGPYIGYKAMDQPLYRNTTPIEEQGYLTTLFAREAVSFIERHKGDPFFLFLSFNAPHFPQAAPKEYVERFKTGDPIRDVYLAMVSAMDDGIGQVLAKLRDVGIEDNTLVFFISDNGGQEHRIGPPDRLSGGSNGILRGEKGEMYEGGIRVPFIVRWPRALPRAQVSTESVTTLDVLPTCMAAAGGQLPGDRVYDGTNLLSMLSEGAERGHDFLFWTMSPESEYAVRRGDWKLVFKDGRVQLFNLAEDVSEARDRSTLEPEKIREMRELYQRMRLQMRESIAGPKRYWKYPPKAGR